MYSSPIYFSPIHRNGWSLWFSTSCPDLTSGEGLTGPAWSNAHQIQRTGSLFQNVVVRSYRGWAGTGVRRKPKGLLPRDLISDVVSSRMSILIICILITSLGIIFIISHLSRGRRSQRNREVTGKSISRNPQASQGPSMVSITLARIWSSFHVSWLKGMAWTEHVWLKISFT